MKIYQTSQKAVTGILRTVFRARVTGLENFPATGPVIVASNHLSFLDSIIISAMMPRRVAFLAKAEYVNTPGPRGRARRLTERGISPFGVLDPVLWGMHVRGLTL